MADDSYSEKERRELVERLKFGDVIRYRLKLDPGDRYLVIKGVENGIVSGQIIFPTGTNAISIDELIAAENLSKADFLKL